MRPSIIRFKAPLFTWSFLVGELEMFLLCLNLAFLSYVFVIFDRSFAVRSIHKKTSFKWNIVLVTVEFNIIILWQVKRFSYRELFLGNGKEIKIKKYFGVLGYVPLL